MSYKTKILHYLQHRVFSPNETKEIADYVGCSKRHVQTVIKEFKEVESNTKLTLENYIAAIQSGCDTKEQIAEYFGVSRMTLLRFEKKNISRKEISRYLYVYGTDIRTIAHLFRLTHEETEKLKNIPTITEIKEQLKAISAILHPLKSSSEKIADQHANVNKIRWEL